MIILTENKLEIEFIEDHNLLKIRWAGQLQARDFRFLLFYLLEFEKAYSIKNVLIDATHMIESPALQQDWVIDFLPHLLAGTGIEKFARVASAIKELNERIKFVFAATENKGLPSCQYGQFQHYYEAMDWLLEGSHKSQQHLHPALFPLLPGERTYAFN